MSDLIPMTRAGYDKLKAELDQMDNVEMPKIAQRIAEARGEGDLSENAEYHGAARIAGHVAGQDQHAARQAKLRAQLVDLAKVPKDMVGFGSTVVVRDLDFGDEEVYVLVGAGEEDYDVGKINVTSPLAQGFMQKKVGDKVEIPVPAGTMKFEIIEIRWE